MKIINGKYKGKTIKSLNNNSVRPTTNKIREAIFNIIEHNNLIFKLNYQDVNYLEIYAGSAIMAFEMISRGVSNVTLIDKNSELKKLCLNNAKILDSEELNFIISDINKLGNGNKKFNFCFIDPPYSLKLEEITLEKLSSGKWLDNEAIVILETDKRNKFNIHHKYKILLEKIYGKTRILFLKYNI